MKCNFISSIFESCSLSLLLNFMFSFLHSWLIFFNSKYRLLMLVNEQPSEGEFFTSMYSNSIHLVVRGREKLAVKKIVYFISYLVCFLMESKAFYINFKNSSSVLSTIKIIIFPSFQNLGRWRNWPNTSTKCQSI